MRVDRTSREEIYSQMGLSEGEKKIARMTIDISGGPRSQRERHKKVLEKELQSIDYSALQERIKQVKENIQSDYAAGREDWAESEEDVLTVLTALGQLMVMENKQDIYDRLSRKKVWEVVRGSSQLEGTELHMVAFQLKKVVERNAEAEFPDELRKQEDIQIKRRESEIAAARERVNKINVR